MKNTFQSSSGDRHTGFADGGDRDGAGRRPEDGDSLISQRHGNGQRVSGHPDKPGHYPALVVIHEWWGLTDWVKEQTQKLAEQGYVALAPDLYRGQVTSDPEVAHELMRGLPTDRAVERFEGGLCLSGHAEGRGSRAHRLDWLVHGRRIFAAARDS